MLGQCEVTVCWIFQGIEFIGEPTEVVYGFQICSTAHGGFTCFPVWANDDDGFRSLNLLGECHQRCTGRTRTQGESRCAMGNEKRG